MRGHCHHQIHFGFRVSALVATSRLKVCSRIPKANLVKNLALLSRIGSLAIISFLCKDHSSRSIEISFFLHMNHFMVKFLQRSMQL